ncbi:MAG: hypothetical protein Q8M92_02135, partial [Candidatus Subteraquimicrobiales bacterium]|nr:hypothetical protein [Candidatus Subteraquimicrobiales bacterium]
TTLIIFFLMRQILDYSHKFPYDNEKPINKIVSLTRNTSMKRTIALLFLFMSVTGWADTISIGDTALDIPNPHGFAAVTPQMTTVYEFQKRFVAPDAEQFIAFIPESALPLALKGEMPDLTRTFSVQTAKKIIDIPVSIADFSKLKHDIKTQYEDTFKRVEKQVPDLMGKINEGITKQYKVNPALSVSQTIPLPPHQETDRTLAFSAFVKYNVNDVSGNSASYVTVVTTTFVHVKSKVLFLISYAEEDGLEWSREISKQWANAIVEANPSDFQSSVKTRNYLDVFIKYAVLGGLVGVIVILIIWASNRRKSS